MTRLCHKIFIDLVAEAGHSADLLKNKGSSHKAQVQMLPTLNKLTELGFEEKHTVKLKKGYNKYSSNQKSLLINIKKLLD